MNRLLFAAPLLIALLLAACGGGSDSSPTPTPAPTIPPGVDGSIPRHLTAVMPQQKSTVNNDQLHVGEDPATGGVCATFDFTVGDTMGDNPAERITMIVDGEDVTDSASFILTASAPPTGGTICYASPQPYEIDTHIATVNYSDATDRKFTYSWSFTVVGLPPPASTSP